MSKERYYYDRITMALDDLLRCKKYCEVMLENPFGKPFSKDRTIYEALFVAFVVSYGRVFNKSNTVDGEFKKSVNNDFGDFNLSIIKMQEDNLQKLHDRIVDKRNTAIAHSDGHSRNYQHYGDTPLAIGRNPYIPYELEEVQVILLLVNNLLILIGDEQSRVGQLAFNKSTFGDLFPKDH
ncbi:hypothetical protein D3C84_535440 [compost metagenome]